MQVERN